MVPLNTDQIESEGFRVVAVSDESDSSTDSSSSDLVRDRSPRRSYKQTRNRLFCADHCNQWVTKSTFYRHQALSVAERKKESNDEDSTDDILKNISFKSIRRSIRHY